MDDRQFSYITKLKRKNLHPSFLYSFSKPTYKTKTWTANMWETTDSNPVRDPSNYLANEKQKYSQ
jgi:hypothetical protein